MMKNLYISILILVSYFSFAQDLDVYKHQKNSNFDIPSIPREMTYEEFKILSTDLRMQDMAIAVILPGHAHFKIDEKKTGYYILGARLAGYTGAVYLSLLDKSLTEIVLKDNLNIDADISTADKITAYTSAALIIGSYLYDWIHAKYKLEEKQATIRYKYAKKKIKLSLSDMHYENKVYPTLILSYNF